MQGLILEGIPAVGKSRALAALRARPSFQGRASTLVLGEQYTERAVEAVEDVAAVRYERLMYRLLAALEPLRVLSVEGRVFQGSGAARRLRYVFERFHLTTVVLHAGGDQTMLRRIENTLRVYQPQVVLLTVSPEELSPRLRDTLSRRPPCWERYLERFGATWDDIVGGLLALQDEYRRALAASILPHLELNISQLGEAAVAARLDALLDAAEVPDAAD
ncbi:MAG: hypothetical protein IT204_11685 [Fimbriimonadaceae bacterium]|nr:hypothetical protein [Fimbriimonadaceae bacterium]